MKRLILTTLLCLIGFISLAQISVTKTEKRYINPIKNNYGLIYDNNDDVYYLVVYSDNEFEDKMLWINIGKKEEAKISIDNVLLMFNEEGDYKIDKHSCHVYNGYSKYIYFYNIGELEFTAGDYKIKMTDIEKYKQYFDNTDN